MATFDLNCRLTAANALSAMSVRRVNALMTSRLFLPFRHSSSRSLPDEIGRALVPTLNKEMAEPLICQNVTSSRRLV